MSRSIESFLVDGLRVSIHRDTDAESPDGWGNDDCYLLAWHRDFTVTRPGYRCPSDVVIGDSAEEDEDPRDIRPGIRADYHVFTLTAYIHGGVYLYLGAPNLAHDPGGWDTSRVGIVLVSRAECPDLDAARKAAACLVDEWNTYLTGDVYGYVVTDPDGEQVEACWGYYGIDAARAEGRDAARGEAKRAAERLAAERLAGNDPRGVATAPTGEDCAFRAALD